MILPSQALTPPAALQTGRQLPVISCCEHFAGSEVLIKKSLQLRKDSGINFDITCDCEDGAELGRENQQIEMIVCLIDSLQTNQGRTGIRVHPPDSPFFHSEVSKSINAVGNHLSYITIPKIRDLNQAHAASKLIEEHSRSARLAKPIPIHFLIETQSALRDCREIACLLYTSDAADE